MRPNSDKVYLQQLIAEGEHQQQDFKFEISDARKIARSLSAFSNTDGGRLLIGVKDNGRIAGVRSEEEIYKLNTSRFRPALARAFVRLSESLQQAPFCRPLHTSAHLFPH